MDDNKTNKQVESRKMSEQQTSIQAQSAKPGKQKSAAGKGIHEHAGGEGSGQLSNERWRYLVDKSSAWIWETDANMHHTYTNAFVTTCLGYQPDEFLQLNTIDLIHPDDHTIFKELVQVAANQKKGWLNMVLRWRHKDGSWRFIETSGSPRFDSDDTFMGLYGVDHDITDHKRAEERRLESESRFRELFETSRDGIAITDLSGRYQVCNHAYLELLGYDSISQLQEKSYKELTPHEYHAFEAEIMMKQTMTRGWCDEYEKEYICKTGGRVPVSLRAWLRKNAEGQPLGIWLLVRDITERKRSDEKLRIKEERYRNLFEQSPVSLWEEDITELKDYFATLRSSGITDLQAYFEEYPDELMKCVRMIRIIAVNRATLEIFDSPDEATLLQGLSQIFTAESYGAFREILVALFEGTGSYMCEAVNWTISGQKIDTLLRWSLLPESATQGSHALISIIDITDRKRAEEALRASEKMLQTIIDTEPECVKLLDENANLIMMNQAGLDMIQADSLEQVKGQCVCPLITSEYRHPFLDLTRRVFQGESGTLLFEVIGMKGRRLWLETRAVPLRNEKNKIFALLGVTRDVTDRKRAEEALRQSEEFIRSILDTVDEGFIVVDRDYRIITANKAYCSQVGVCSENIIGKHCYTMSHKTDRPCYEEGEECVARHSFETGTPHTALHRHKDANDNILYLEIKAYPIKDASGAVTSVIETINNITERYLLEEEQLKNQKLESIGRLAGGIAHDFNNLLQGIFGYISMAKLTHDQKEKSLAMLDQAEEALHLSVNLSTQLLTFSKGGKPVKELIRLQSTIENAVKFALSGSHTDYQLDIVSDLWPVEVDAGQLAQVIQNIVLNADEAMAGGETVNVSVKNMDISPKANPRLPEGGRFVRIDIQDTGIGIPQQNMSKIFDPYFTTKQMGSGLGLATSYSIIKNHGGLIEVKSEPNRGTTFTIYLPASRETEITPEPAAPLPATTKTFKVLLMDDEDIVRNVAKEMIAALGHDVVSAEDGRKAIELCNQAREAGRPFDLVILDLTVKGGMGGEEAIAKIRDIDPNVMAVVSSGYADSAVMADYRDYGFSAVLNKPYRLDALKDCLNLIIS